MNIQNLRPQFAFRAASKYCGFAVHVKPNEIEVTGNANGGRRIRVPELDFELHVKINKHGKPVLSFDYMSMSDFHLGTRQSRAKRSSKVFEHTEARRLDLTGDLFDGEHMLEKDEHHLAEWHRQATAHILRKADAGTIINYPPGNHDVAIRNQTTIYSGEDVTLGPVALKAGTRMLHHNLCGKTILGVNVAEYVYYTDPKGRRFKVIHGDQFDDVLFGKHKGLAYHIGSPAYDLLLDVDARFQSIPRCENLSIAAVGKRATKTIINVWLGVRKAMVKTLDDDSSIDGIIYGHSHMHEMARTPKGKLVINDGCCTEHVQAAVHDRNGTWANLEFHNDRLVIRSENGHQRTVSWNLLGMAEAFAQEPTMFDDNDPHVQKADRLERLMYRLWPPKERQEKTAAAEIMRRDKKRAVGELVMPPIPIPKRKVFKLHSPILSSQSMENT